MKYLVSSIYYGLRDLVNSPNKSLGRKGYQVIENLLSDELCDKLVQDISNKIEIGEISWKDKESSDYRIMGYNHSDNEILNEIDKLVKRNFDQYVGSLKNFKFFRMANIVIPKRGNLGSGGGWHRDSLNRRQLKLMIYLTDVSSSNGPFEYIEGSHGLAHKLRFNLISSNVRFGAFEKIVHAKSRIFTAPKGTGIIFDSSGVHRGNPIDSDKRVAITYYTFSNKIPSHLEKFL